MGIFDLAKLGRFGLVALGLIGAWATWLWQHDRTVIQTERAAGELKSTINANKADAARRSAEQLPADRLRDRYFRD